MKRWFQQSRNGRGVLKDLPKSLADVEYVTGGKLTYDAQHRKLISEGMVRSWRKPAHRANRVAGIRASAAKIGEAMKRVNATLDTKVSRSAAQYARRLKARRLREKNKRT